MWGDVAWHNVSHLFWSVWGRLELVHIFMIRWLDGEWRMCAVNRWRIASLPLGSELARVASPGCLFFAAFGLVGHLQGDERAAQRYGGHRYEVGEGCASPGRRGSDHLCRVDVYGVGQALPTREGACVWHPVEQRGCAARRSAWHHGGHKDESVCDAEWHNITHLFCDGRVRLEHGDSVRFLRLEVVHLQDDEGATFCASVCVATGRRVASLGCVFSTECDNLSADTVRAMREHVGVTSNGNGEDEPLGGVHGIRAEGDEGAW